MTRNNRDPLSRLPEGDDGRTIANMNVEGMPWYSPERPDQPPKTLKREFRDGLSKKQMRMYTFSALKAAMLVTLVMCMGIVAFVAFCVFVWFR